MQGRKKKPKELKKLSGSRWYDDSVPDADGKPMMPSDMTDGAKREWRYIVPLLAAKGILDKTDRFVLESYCESVATAREARDILKREMTKLAYRNEAGNWFKNPYVLIEKDARAAAMKYAGLLGLSPVDRGRVVMAESTQDDEIDLLMKRAKQRVG